MSNPTYLPTGSTLLNLALSNDPFGGWLAGKYYLLIGDTESGKTCLSMTCFAEAMQHPDFQDYHLVFDDAEGGNIFAIEELFGEKVADQINPPAEDAQGDPVNSNTIEDFYAHLENWLDSGESFIYVLDSQDALGSDAENKRFETVRDAREKDKEYSGSYGDGKAKVHSANLRRVLARLALTNSILIIINQTRDNITGFGRTKTRSGGRALPFYACCSLWTSRRRTIKRKIRGKDRNIGIQVQIEIEKNRIQGRSCKIEVPIFPDYGIDDIRSCIEYLIEEGHWSKKGSVINASEWEWSGNMKQLIAFVEDNDREKELRGMVGNVWREIIEQSAQKRRKRYSNPTGNSSD